MKIETSRTANDTPNRSVDYCATFKGYEEGDIMGFGATVAEAEADLTRQVEDGL